MSEQPQDRGRRNIYCSRCGDERGGPYGHETNECTWKREDSWRELVGKEEAA